MKEIGITIAKNALGSILLGILCNVSLCQADTLNDFNFLTSSKGYQKVLVTRVISADTIQLESGEKIKLIGLKAPLPPKPKKIERDSDGRVIEKITHLMPLDERAFGFARSLMENQYVRIEFDQEKRDEDFKTLGYVFLVSDQTFLNVEILRQGYANLQLRPLNTKYNKELRAAYQEARQEKRGLQGQ